MNGILKKILTWFVLPVIIAALVVVIVNSVSAPVKFNKQKDYRESVGIQRLKDIRTLQVAYKAVNGKFTSQIDSLKLFYETGKMAVIMQVGSADDSLAFEHTKAIKAKLRGVKPSEIDAKLYELYKAGDKNLVFKVANEIPVKDTLFASREDFCIDSLKTIPFSGGQAVEMEAITKLVSGVQVPLFEARMPYKKLLKGLDNQLRINLDSDRRDQNKYEGLQVGSVTAPNNNAGNWE